MAARISARLDDEAQAKLTALQNETHKTVTELVTEALELYYQQHRLQSADSNQALLKLAGQFDGPADLSGRYKDVFAEGMDDKHKHHR